MDTTNANRFSAAMIINNIIAVLKILKDNNKLDELENDLGDIYRKMCVHTAKVDVEVLDIYQKDGKLTKGEALQLLIASKIAVREMLGQHKKMNAKS